MSKQKPSIPKGTRDFGPPEMAKRTFILDHIRAVYRKYGFQPLETPSMENLSVLTGKYGDEGDKLLFRVLDSGEFFKSAKDEFVLSSSEIAQLTSFLEEFIDNNLETLLENTREFHGSDNEKILAYVDEQFKNAVDSKKTFYPYISGARRIWEALKEFFSKFGGSRVYIDQIYSKGLDKLNFDSQTIDGFKNTVVSGRLIPFFTHFYSKQQLEKANSSELVPQISEKGLRYDLTVPFARYVVMNQGELTFPFRRFQIQPVWRADRPQKGRYREFYQCDADVVGTDSLTCEAEIVLMIEEVFERLGIHDISIKINNRKILSGVVEAVGALGKENELLVAIDKLDKIGQEKVIEELQEKGFSTHSIDKLMPIFSLKGNNLERLTIISLLIGDSEIGQQGIHEMEEVMHKVAFMGSEAATLEFDITLARGLSYYTGAIFEVKANNSSLSSSISGGGRYDNLTGVFGMPGMSGVGISFGVDRIYDVMEELGLFPEENLAGTQVLLIAFDEETEKHALFLLRKLRRAGISAEIYPDQVKLKKQFTYADKKGIPYTLVVGAEEIQKQAYGLKNLKSGQQEMLGMDEIIKRLQQ